MKAVALALLVLFVVSAAAEKISITSETPAHMRKVSRRNYLRHTPPLPTNGDDGDDGDNGNECGWILHLHEDFQGDSAKKYGNSITTCGGNKIWGGYCKFGRGEVNTSFELLPQHTHLRLKSNFYFLDAWDGEAGYAMIDGDVVWSRTCNNAGSHGVNVCGARNYPDEIGQVVDVIVPHTSSTVVITFGANTDEDPCNESWGVGNLMIYVCPCDECGEYEDVSYLM
eukprot:TRINITY_DN34214_c0_g1_i1.p2 TRINITY_DN34214_c0_g1~~TRINITY_DN34214_c0_g1_i1.p2  ORF type:complete len:241 (+),score=42.05 TRINITY_DN34214_c0_g1_i1:48-725(+)